ncbi:Hint domain-containing protein [Phaeobacter sp. B1627]|uniref:Hint domain-containing protein n=1 Tax=Phaeobacter sp. B1627 TaxID=2583809 RepID=UPI0011193E1B|nr:Hint domain-containing protein [Phaeobacter sp. B1627]TNJ48445.1 Hint domain-containing protein [Phaeobacter sp. B1627]
MKTGFRGTYVISWTQTEIDGLDAAPLAAVDVGATWSWHGDAVRVDGPSEFLCPDMLRGDGDLRQQAARMVRRLVGAAVQNRTDIGAVNVDDPATDSTFVVTNGVRIYTVTLIETGAGGLPLLMFVDEVPPRNTDLWVVHHTSVQPTSAQIAQDPGVICFTPGTRIATPSGPRQVQSLREGDLVQTRDNGAQRVQWIGARRMSGARLFVMPHLRPVRICAGALGIDRPEQELLVSPEHRMLLRGHAARALFNVPEVLVAARDLVNNRTISVDQTVTEVTYVHLLLENHQVIWANGVETESFHPAHAALSALDNSDRRRLLRRLPGIEADPASYGAFARRNLSASEAAILMQDAA